MAFWRRGKKKQAKPTVDPIAAYDKLLEDLERRGAQIRKSAATLLALRGDLERDKERNERRSDEIGRRIDQAAKKGDAAAERVLRRDEQQTRRLVETASEALAQAEADAQLLLEAAQEVSDRVAELREERSGAKARLAAGLVVTNTLEVRSERFNEVLALDAARDEVEKAHQLAQIYREERKARG